MKLGNNHNWTFFLESGQKWKVCERRQILTIFSWERAAIAVCDPREQIPALTALILICAELQPFQYLCCFIALFFIGLLVLFVSLVIYYFYLIFWLRVGKWIQIFLLLWLYKQNCTPDFSHSKLDQREVFSFMETWNLTFQFFPFLPEHVR